MYNCNKRIKDMVLLSRRVPPRNTVECNSSYWKDASTVKYDIEVCRTFKTRALKKSHVSLKKTSTNKYTIILRALPWWSSPRRKRRPCRRSRNSVVHSSSLSVWLASAISWIPRTRSYCICHVSNIRCM